MVMAKKQKAEKNEKRRGKKKRKGKDQVGGRQNRSTFYLREIARDRSAHPKRAERERR